MLHRISASPEGLWMDLGRQFFGKDQKAIDYAIANRRFFSFNNILTVDQWPKAWDNPLMFDLIGYSDVGTKMGILSRSYLNPAKWDEFQQALNEYDIRNRTSGIKTFGMPFNMNPMGKGGCLSSFHVIQRDKDIDIIVHMKVAELPRKFVADLRFVSALITALDFHQKDHRVTFMLSSLYYSIIGLRAFIPVLGQENMNYHGLPIDEHRNYQVGVQEGIYKARTVAIKRWGKQIMQDGITLDQLKEGRTTCPKDQIAQHTS